ncbi:MAG: hypothetical protein ACREEM_05120 [Blastocatellia bacterium]
MPARRFNLICIATLAWLCLTAAAFAQATISNRAYQITVNSSPPDGYRLTVARRDDPRVRRTITPAPRLFYSDRDPGFQRASLKEEGTTTAGWKAGATAAVETDLFKVAPFARLTRPMAMTEDAGRKLTFVYEPTAQAAVSLLVELPEADGAPIIELRLTPKVAGWFSAGFAGLEPRAASSLDFLYAPLVWSWLRFPAQSYLTPEAFCTTAATFTNNDRIAEGITPDPAEIPYRFAKFDNSRFGLVLRDEEGLARPMLFAPVLGGAESRRAAGETCSFKCRYVLMGGDWYAGLQHVLGDIFHYRDERQNATVSLNRTLENMIAYAMDDHYSGWVEELKDFDYRRDVPGTVKVVSALHPLGVALVTGDEEIYRRRALPAIEYVMSRQKYLYATDESITKQNPSHFLRGPCDEHRARGGADRRTAQPRRDPVECGRAL